MNDTMARLRALQEIDNNRTRALRDCQRIPREQQQRFSEVEAVRVRLEREREEAKRMRAEEKNLELEMKSREEKLEKLRIQANMARDTSTLLATNHQIQSIKDENSKLEDRALGLVERIGELEKEFEKHEKDLARVQGEYDVFAKACEAELAKAKEELAAHDKKRAEVAGGIPAEPAELYDRLLQARDGLAVCAVDGESCVGCGGEVSPNDLVKLRNGRDVVRCKSCSRILYIDA